MLLSWTSRSIMRIESFTCYDHVVAIYIEYLDSRSFKHFMQESRNEIITNECHWLFISAKTWANTCTASCAIWCDVPLQDAPCETQAVQYVHVYHLVCLESMSSPRGAIVRAAMQSLCATKRCSSRIRSRSQNDTSVGIGLKDTSRTSYSTKGPAAVKFDHHHQLSKKNKIALYIFLSCKSFLCENGRTCSLCFISKGTTVSKSSGQSVKSCEAASCVRAMSDTALEPMSTCQNTRNTINIYQQQHLL